MPKQLLHDPRDFHMPESTDNELTMEERNEMQDLVYCKWPPFLSGGEFKVVNFIYQRTIRYGKRWAYVSADTLEHGYPYKEYRNVSLNIRSDGARFLKKLTPTERSLIERGDHMITGPTGLSRAQVFRALASLVERGFVFRIIHGNEPEMALNPDANYDYVGLLLDRKRK